jgi:hypothetical protein
MRHVPTIVEPSNKGNATVQQRSETFIVRLTAVDDGESPLTWRGNVQRVSTGQIVPLREVDECLDQLRHWLSTLPEDEHVHDSAGE